MLQYYFARLAFRPFEKDFSPLLYSGKLLHQYIVDAFVKIESNRINWIKSHQSALHVEQYRGLMDYVKNNSGVKNNRASNNTAINFSSRLLLINILTFTIYFYFSHRVVREICNKIIKMLCLLYENLANQIYLLHLRAIQNGEKWLLLFFMDKNYKIDPI